MIYFLPVLPQLYEDFLGYIFRVFPGAQAVVGKGVNPLPVLFCSLPVLSQHL
jgi:hypothetical protein